MKAIISIMIIIVGVLVFLVVDTDVTETTVSSEQYVATSNSNTDSSISKETSADGATESSKIYAENSSNKNNLSDSGNNSRYNYDDSTYENNSSSYENNGSSYKQDTQSYGNTNSSYNQLNSSTSNTPSVSQTNSNTVRDNSEVTEKVDKDEDSEMTEEENTTKFQRLYDNGIMWYGETGTLNIEYQSSHAETTGIGFRVHYDSSSIRPINITQYPVDAIVTTTPSIAANDSDNRDNNFATDSFLPFAWASIYGQWPQANELNLAAIEFEKVSGGSDNYTINYSAVSVPAGFQLVK